MNILIKDRGKGKTTGLIYTSEATGYPIVTLTHDGVDYIKQQAHELECTIPEPITVQDLRNKRENRYESVLVDDVDCILGDALKEYLGCEVECGTMTHYSKQK